jgi:chondroitin-sulfate-ABC endolyase/exolyase
MERTKEDGSVVMSICTPDLGITEKGYTTTQPSQPLARKVILNGKWSLNGSADNVNISVEGEQTVIVATCQHGQPVEFNLKTN